MLLIATRKLEQHNKYSTLVKYGKNLEESKFPWIFLTGKQDDFMNIPKLLDQGNFRKWSALNEEIERRLSTD